MQHCSRRASAHFRNGSCHCVGVVGIMFCLMTLGCSSSTPVVDHGHDTGSHGGIVVSVGNEHYHVEALFVNGELRIGTLGEDQTQVVTVPMQDLVAYIRSPKSVESISIPLKPEPQAGDPKGQTSMFVGKVPADLIGADVIVVVQNLMIGNRRHRVSFMTQAGQHEPTMPANVQDDAERELYLTPGGVYTSDDIVANGSQTASQRYRGFKSAHDMHPVPGDRICPITHTKANPNCKWTIGGKEYLFCCPPCIDEFMKKAKSDKKQIEPPEVYVKQ